MHLMQVFNYFQNNGFKFGWDYLVQSKYSTSLQYYDPPIRMQINIMLIKLLGFKRWKHFTMLKLKSVFSGLCLFYKTQVPHMCEHFKNRLQSPSKTCVLGGFLFTSPLLQYIHEEKIKISVVQLCNFQHKTIYMLILLSFVAAFYVGMCFALFYQLNSFCAGQL